MPELPEVETIRGQLAPHLEGRTIERVALRDPRWTAPLPVDVMARELTGARIERIARSGKYLIWELDGDRHLIVHLRMTGSWLFVEASPATQEPAHTHIRMELDDGHLLLYVDPRRFGTGHLVHSRAAREAYFAARLGPEPLTPAFTAAYLRTAARGRSVPIKTFILDQKRIAGVGNIYADEALFRAMIHPLRPAGSLTTAQWEALKAAIEVSLQAGIDAKGASIDDFRHVDGARGTFQDDFLVHTRAGEPCYSCGTIIQKIVVGGRGTYFCPHEQRAPRRTRTLRAASS